MLDQGTDEALIFNQNRQLIETIDLGLAALEEHGYDWNNGGAVVPHMIDFDSEYRYAFIAATAGAATIVVDARAKEVVAVLQTGAGSHMAAVTPDDSAVWVAAIGAQHLARIDIDWDDRGAAFTFGDAFPLFSVPSEDQVAAGQEPRGLLWDYAQSHADTQDWLNGDGTHSEDVGRPFAWPSFSPVCHQYVENGDRTEAWVTLGPGATQGGLFVLDVTEPTDPVVTTAFDPTVVKANCGVGVTADGNRVITNWSGSTYEPDGEWYVFDAIEHELLDTGSSRGVDAHGVRLTPDGNEFWMVNRGSGDGVIIDARTFEEKRTLFGLGDTPDILDFSPDGRHAYITQRGPNPRSGGGHVATGQEPGILIVDVATREEVGRLAPALAEDDSDRLRNDVHGVGVRPTTGKDGHARGPAAPVEVRVPPAARRAIASTPAADILSIHCRI
jgi:DNA-binding beta-propeller fold protein YncE